MYAGTICLSLQIRNWLLEQLPALGEVALYRLSSSTPVLPCHSSWQGTETPRGNFRSRLSFGVIYDSAVLLILSPASRTCDPMRLPVFNLHSALQGSEGVTIMLAECLPQCGAGPRVLHKQVPAALTCVLEPKQQSAVRWHWHTSKLGTSLWNLVPGTWGIDPSVNSCLQVKDKDRIRLISWCQVQGSLPSPGTSCGLLWCVIHALKICDGFPEDPASLCVRASCENATLNVSLTSYCNDHCKLGLIFWSQGHNCTA